MASLNDDPRNYELEDFVAAHLASRGVFVETGVTERDPDDILELDVVWTNYDVKEAPRQPIEIKSGDWGIGDIFKFHGWSNYLGIDSGWFICRRPNGRIDQDSILKLCNRLGISFCHIDDPSDVEQSFAEFGLGAPSSAELPEIWRYSYWIRRRLLRTLKLSIEKDVCPESAKAAKDYRKLINDAVFFEPDIPSRVSTLLEAHFGHPRLARTAAAETAGMGVDFDNPADAHVFKEALFCGKHFPVQTCFYLAHRGRLGVLKAAVDYVVAEEAGTLRDEPIRIFGKEISLANLKLHSAFQETMSLLRSSENYRNYPVFWQVFLWGWGGFILEDRRESDYQELSAQTGVPVEQIDHALAIWSTLFPIDGGWFATPANDSRRQLKLMPPVLRGLGAFARLIRAGVKEYADLGLADQTPQRLASDHNSTVRLLDGDDEELVK